VTVVNRLMAHSMQRAGREHGLWPGFNNSLVASRALHVHGTETMSKLLRGLAAGYGAKKLGGGCFSTVLIFLVLWWLLGNFNIFQ